jgi:hypothetical protein
MVPGDIFTYGSSTVFTLTESNVIAVTKVLKNDVETTSYTYSSTTNKVTVSASLTSGDTIEVQYTYYPNFSATEIASYLETALMHLSINNYYDWEIEGTSIVPTPAFKEVNLIAYITATLLRPDNKSIRLPDFSISVPKDLPINEKISKIIASFKRNSHGTFGVL